MKGTTIALWILGIIVVAMIAKSIWGSTDQEGGRSSNQASSPSQNTNSQSQVTSKILTRIIKNEQGTLSLISYNSVTNEIVNSRILTFNEAVAVAGGHGMVCLGAPNGRFGASYPECATIRVGRG